MGPEEEIVPAGVDSAGFALRLGPRGRIAPGAGKWGSTAHWGRVSGEATGPHTGDLPDRGRKGRGSFVFLPLPLPSHFRQYSDVTRGRPGLKEHTGPSDTLGRPTKAVPLGLYLTV